MNKLSEMAKTNKNRYIHLFESSSKGKMNNVLKQTEMVYLKIDGQSQY